MAKKHLIMIASVAAGLAIAAPTAMAATPSLPELPALPAAPTGQTNDGTCTDEPGTATTQSDQTALQLPVSGHADSAQANCQSSGNDQGNGAGGDMSFPPSLPQ